jgi:uncharacterized membrane protein
VALGKTVMKVGKGAELIGKRLGGVTLICPVPISVWGT